MVVPIEPIPPPLDPIPARRDEPADAPSTAPIQTPLDPIPAQRAEPGHHTAPAPSPAPSPNNPHPAATQEATAPQKATSPTDTETLGTEAPAFHPIEEDVDERARAVVRQVTESHAGQSEQLIAAELTNKLLAAGIEPHEPAFTATVRSIAAAPPPVHPPPDITPQAAP